MATPLALSMIWNPSKEIVADRLYGYGVAEGRLSAFAVGYFIWDAFVSAKHIKTQVSTPLVLCSVATTRLTGLCGFDRVSGSFCTGLDAGPRSCSRSSRS